MEREKQHMVEAMMKKKNVNKKQLDEYFKEVKMKTHDEKDIRKMRLEADETYRDIVNKLLIDNQAEKSVNTSTYTYPLETYIFTTVFFLQTYVVYLLYILINKYVIYIYIYYILHLCDTDTCRNFDTLGHKKLPPQILFF